MDSSGSLCVDNMKQRTIKHIPCLTKDTPCMEMIPQKTVVRLSKSSGIKYIETIDDEKSGYVVDIILPKWIKNYQLVLTT